ncbi:MAG: alpha/beta fold hydrolase [Chloroflexi bacterium]|nr:alpha/beta fold hydrolase [Chloroflexota bacterium]
MSSHPLDHPDITANLFYPRPDQPGRSGIPGAVDGTLPVEEGVALGYRFYMHGAGSPIILYFHGNGEIASDYDGIAPFFQEIGASLLVVDYRGYGWSTGFPLASKLLPDAEAVVAALPSMFATAKVSESRLFVMGRSLGSAPAVHAACTFPDRFQGLILESGFADMPSVMRRLGIQPERFSLTEQELAPVGNARKVRSLHLPLLVIHGEPITCCRSNRVRPSTMPHPPSRSASCASPAPATMT